MREAVWMGVLLVRQLRQAIGLCCLLLVLSGCVVGGAPPFPSYDTMDEALSGPLTQPIKVVYQEPFGPGRAMVLFQTEQNGLSHTILQQSSKKWRMTKAVGINGPLPRLGPLSYGRGSLGQVEKKVGTVTQVTAEAHVIYGESFDPTITWVELTMDQPGAPPIRTTIRNGFWAVIVPPEKQNTWFDIRAGNAEGERFTAWVGSRRQNQAPPQYHDAQLGVRFVYPDDGAYLRLDEQGRLLVSVSLVEIAIERRTGPSADDPEQQLIASTPKGSQILEHDLRTLGGHSAGYLLTVHPEAEADRFSYEMRYIVPVQDVEFAVTCTTQHIFERAVWESNWRPVCAQALAGLRLGD